MTSISTHDHNNIDNQISEIETINQELSQSIFYLKNSINGLEKVWLVFILHN